MFGVVGGAEAPPPGGPEGPVRLLVWSPRPRRSAVQVAEVAVLPGVDVALVLGAVRSGGGVLVMEAGGDRGVRHGARVGEVLGHWESPLGDRLNQDLGFPSSLT